MKYERFEDKAFSSDFSAVHEAISMKYSIDSNQDKLSILNKNVI
jgi:hypothetical protein